MNNLTNEELKNVKAGALRWGIIGLIGGIVAFVVGVIDGYTNPTKCRQ